MATKQSNTVDDLEQLYTAFNQGDIETVLAGMTEDITWTEPESDPYGGTYHSPDAVLENVFGTIQEDFQAFGVHPDRFIDQDDIVAVEGAYQVTSNTGTDFEIPFVHVCEVKDGKLHRFTNYTDTVLMQRAFEP